MAEESESKQVAMMAHIVELSERQTQYSVERSEMSEVRSYFNAERTLSVWVRTALSMMIVSVAIDRFGLLFDHTPGGNGQVPSPHSALLDTASTATCMALVLLGVIMVLATGIRFLLYARSWSRQHRLPAHHGPFMAPFFAGMTALFGIVLVVIMAMA